MIMHNMIVEKEHDGSLFDQELQFHGETDHSMTIASLMIASFEHFLYGHHDIHDPNTQSQTD
jgi:hypothetical protein